jgi:hypothetical protein
VAALDFTGQIAWNDMCPGVCVPQPLLCVSLVSYRHPDALSLGRAKVVLDNGCLSGSIVADGSFVMYVPARIIRNALLT